MDFVIDPSNIRSQRQFNLTQEERKVLDEKMQEMDRHKVIEPIPPDEEHLAVESAYFIVHQPPKMRPCLNCSPLNSTLKYEHFKMKGWPTIKSMLRRDDFLMKTDIKSAYHALLIDPLHRNWTAFRWNGQLYRHRAAFFGLSRQLGINKARCPFI